MSQMRLNQLTGRWVTIVAERAHAADRFRADGAEFQPVDDRATCPFCPGNEEITPPALETFDDSGEWQMRVVPNLYPAFAGRRWVRRPPRRPRARDGRGHRHPRGVRLHAATTTTVLDRLDDDAAAAVHARAQVAVHRPRHDAATSGTPRRSSTTAAKRARRSPTRTASSSALPFVPGEVLDEERAFARFAGGCLLCTTVEAELATGERIVIANDDVAVIAPYWSGTPVRAADRPSSPRAPPAGRSDDALAGRRSGAARRDGVPQPGDRRRRVQRRVPHRPTRAHRRVPLARPRLAEPRHPGRLRARDRRDDQHRAARAGCRDAPRRSCRSPVLTSRFERDITVSIDIDAPVATVWAALEPVETHVDWMADADAIRFIGDQTRGVGTRVRLRHQGRPAAPHRRDGDHRSGRRTPRWASSTVAWSPARGSFELVPIDLDRRCRMTWSETLSFPWWMGGPIGARIGGAVLRQIWRRNLTAFRRLIDDAAASSA